MEVLIYISCVALGVFSVEFVGYFWHRWVEHRELLGKGVTFRHYRHHEVEYPVNKLRTKNYRNANSWTWYVVGTITTVCAAYIAPWQYAVAFGIGGWVYAWGIVLNMHSAFHVSDHLLWKFKWFQKLVHLHDIHHYDNCNYGICLFFMDKLFGTYRDDFPLDANGHRIKKNVFMSYPLHRTHHGPARS
jgi:sterol desaturase/sphingolipid hydroxylase (fatty acid hydroxylase superfamily)